MKVLIIDDSKILRKRLVDMISDIGGIETIEAEGSDEAFNLLKEQIPDAIILDIRLQGESGTKILERIKKSRPKIKVIMFTNYPYPQYRKKCKALGADYFLDKSSEFEKMTRILRKIGKIGTLPCFS